MIRIFAAIAVLTVMISTASVYNLKQATYDLEEKKQDISAQILKDRQAIKVLKAEMAYLSRPDRLERLSRRHLVLDATKNEQLVVDLNELTVRGDVQMANMPVDNFQLLLPRQKPNPLTFVKINEKQNKAADVRLASYANSDEKQNVILKKEPEQKSLYERILAKIGN